jgi:hypothetical protein
MSDTPIRTNVLKPLYVTGDYSLKFALYRQTFVDGVLYAGYLGIGQIFGPYYRANLGGGQNVGTRLRAYSINISKRNLNLLVVGDRNS